MIKSTIRRIYNDSLKVLYYLFFIGNNIILEVLLLILKSCNKTTKGTDNSLVL